MVLSKSYGTSNADLRRALANVIKKICTEKFPVDKTKEETALGAFLACRLIPFDKKPGLRPIRVSEVLRRIAGKVVMKVEKEDINPIQDWGQKAPAYQFFLCNFYKHSN